MLTTRVPTEWWNSNVGITESPHRRVENEFDAEADVLRRTTGAMPMRPWRRVPATAILAEIGYHRLRAARALRRTKTTDGRYLFAAATIPAIGRHAQPPRYQCNEDYQDRAGQN